MKKGAGFANMSRGGLVDPAALDAALRCGHLSGAVIDVTYPEPPPADWPYWDTPNLIITPHVLSDDIDAYVPRTLDLFFDNLRRYFAGEPLTNLVDLERAVLIAMLHGGTVATSSHGSCESWRSAGRRSTSCASISSRPTAGRFAPFTPGAHIDVHAPNGRCGSTRCAATRATRRATRSRSSGRPAGRGGSRSMHDDVEEGSALGIVGPRNHFPLAAEPRTACSSPAASASRRSTPWRSRSRRDGRSWELHYCARSHAHAAFYRRAAALPGGARDAVLQRGAAAGRARRSCARCGGHRTSTAAARRASCRR